jgi:hypothetical protein
MRVVVRKPNHKPKIAKLILGRAIDLNRPLADYHHP